MTDRVQKGLLIAALCAAYFVLGRFGLKFASIHSSVTLVWPATGVALAALLIGGIRLWPGIFAGAFLVNLTASGAIASSVGIAIGNTLEGVAGAWLVARFAGGRDCLKQVRTIFAFVVLAALWSTAISATIGVLSLIGDGLAPLNRFGAIWMTWWLGDAVGALLVAPLLLAWHANLPLNWNWRKVPERVLFYVTVAFFGVEVFAPASYNHILSFASYPLTFLAMPILLWASFRLGFRAAMTGTAVLAIIAVWGTIQGAGPFAVNGPYDAMLLVQLFIGIIAVTILVVAATRHQLEQYRRRLEQANAELTEATLTDALTGAHNRRGFDQRLADELERAARYQQPLSLLLMDVDLFKQHNDAFGHLAGDEVLKSVVRLLQAHVRATDTIARQGGDEFAVLLPNTGSDGAVVMAERFRSAIERAKWEGKPVTVTVGAATLPTRSTHGAKLLALADQALYEAKEAGRNRVVQARVPSN